MSNPKIEWIRAGANLSYVKCLDIYYPMLKYGPKGTKILVVFDTLPIPDIEKGKFLGSEAGTAFDRVLDRAILDAGKSPSKLFALASRPVNGKAYNKLSDAQKEKVSNELIARINRVVTKFKPNVVVFSGMSLLGICTGATNAYKIKPFQDVDTLPSFHGVLLDANIEGHKCKVVTTFSLRHVASQDPKDYKSSVNLLGFFMKAFSTAINGANRYEMPDLNFTPIIITDYESWCKFFKKFKKAPIKSIDTETDNLNRVADNSLLTIQITLDGEVTYVLPWSHPDSTLKASEIEKIRGELRDYFENVQDKMHIYQGGKFDLIQFRRELGIKFYATPIWDIQAGEFFLNENRKFLNRKMVKGILIERPYALETIALSYKGIAYLEGNVGKKDRANLAKKPLIEVAYYGSKDVLYPWHIQKFQLAEAKHRGLLYKKYKQCVLGLGSDMFHTFAEMEFNGSLIDRDYIQGLLMPNSELNQRLFKEMNKFQQSKAAQRVNKWIAKSVGKEKRNGLLGQTKQPWLFNINKKEHAQRLFYHELGLKPLRMLKNGSGAVDKLMFAEYKDLVPEVEIISNISGLQTKVNTFVKGFHKRIREEPDMRYDGRLRANYSFLQILTVRSGANNPNLQNIPSRGPDAKIIKREFISNIGRIQVKRDYNANEIRGWCNVSKDIKIKSSFVPGMKMRVEMRVLRQEHPELHEINKRLHESVAHIADKEERKSALKKVMEKTGRKNRIYAKLQDLNFKLASIGDVHRSSYEYYFGVPAAEVTDTQRSSVKDVVFGTLYDKAARALSLRINEKALLKARREYGIDSDQYEALLDKFKNEAQIIIDKMFARFKQGAKWKTRTRDLARQTYTVLSPLGNVRHLDGYMHNEREVQSMMDRRAANSPIQGMSSLNGYIGARNMQIICHKARQLDIDLNFVHTNSVHDADEAEIDVITMPMALYYFEHSVTTLVRKKLHDYYDFDLTVDLESEMQLGPNLADVDVWDYSAAALIDLGMKTIKWQTDNKNAKFNINKIEKQLTHNAYAMEKIRIRELKGEANSLYTAPKMLKDHELYWKPVQTVN